MPSAIACAARPLSMPDGAASSSATATDSAFHDPLATAAPARRKASRSSSSGSPSPTARIVVPSSASSGCVWPTLPSKSRRLEEAEVELGRAPGGHDPVGEDGDREHRRVGRHLARQR